MFTHANHVVAIIGLQLLLAIIQPHLGLTNPESDGTAHQAVQHGHPDHKARHLNLATAQRLGHRQIHHSAEPPQDAHKADKGHHRVEQAHGQRHCIGGEQVQIFLNPLIWIVWHAMRAVAPQLQPIKGFGLQPALLHIGRQPAAPVQLQQLGEVKLVDRDHDVDQRQPGKPPQLLPEHIGLLVLQSVIEHPVPLIEQNQHVDRRQIQPHDGDQ